MGLECLLLTRDAVLLNDIRSHFNGLGIDLIVRKDASAAVDAARGRHLDGFVIDCDDLPGGREALHKIRNGNPANKLSMILAVVRPTTAVSEIFSLGANFALTKPVRGSRLRAILEIAIPKMEREHRRYYRYQIEIAASLCLSSGEVIQAATANVSENGIALRLQSTFSGTRNEGVTVAFDVRGDDAFHFSAQAAVVWERECVAGMRILHMEPDCRDRYDSWLKSLDAKLRFNTAVESSREVELLP
jgi:DNA-binding response OmpR family regulator